MHKLLSLTLALSLGLAAPAAAETFRGSLEQAYVPAPTAESPERKAEIHRLVTTSGAIVLEKVDPFTPLGSLVGRGPVVLEGELVEGRLRVERIAKPTLQLFKGTVYRTRPGMAGVIRVRLEGGEDVALQGIPWLVFRKMTEGMREHAIEFEAFAVKDGKGKLSELVATRVKATAGERLVLTRNVFSYKGEVPAGEEVWVSRRSLIGISALVEGPEGKTGYALWDRLQIGREVEPREGAAQKLQQSR